MFSFALSSLIEQGPASREIIIQDALKTLDEGNVVTVMYLNAHEFKDKESFLAFLQLHGIKTQVPK